MTLLVALACSQDAAPPLTARTPEATPGALEPSEPFGVTTVTLRSPDSADVVVMPAYDAHTGPARRRGLMHRRSLPETAGMVFRFPGERDGGFWMRNTVIPLSIAFFDAGGVVLDVQQMEPCRTPNCPRYAPGQPYTGALEVNQGYFDTIGLQPGWRVELPAGLPPPR